MKAADAAEAAREEDEDVLEIALAPTAIALGVFDQAGWNFFVAFFQIVSVPDAPMIFSEQGGLDEIVAENLAAEGFFAGQMREVAILHEGPGANDGVVADVIAEALDPVVGAGGEERSVEAIAELLKAPEEGFGVDGGGRSLDERDGRMRFHKFDEFDDRLAGHETVGVEHDEVAVLIAEDVEKIANVAAFFSFVDETAAVEDAAFGAQGFGEVEPTAFFVDPIGSFGGVAQDVEVEVGDGSSFLERDVSGAEACVDFGGAFVVDGEEDDCAGFRDVLIFKIAQRGDALGIAAEAHPKTIEAVHGAVGVEEEQGNEEA